MFVRRRTFNPKRQLYPAESLPARQEVLAASIDSLRYSGNPEHKRSPGDFGLHPPSSPRPGKTLCDRVNIHNRAQALTLLRAGLERGTFSVQERDGWPQNVWAVTENGEPLEAQLEGNGVYHGYPMAEADPFREKVLERWPTERAQKCISTSNGSLPFKGQRKSDEPRQRCKCVSVLR
jgi:hypothetical protein